jgi:hypothetical protein
MRTWQYRPPDRPFFARVLRIGLLFGQKTGFGNHVAHAEAQAVDHLRHFLDQAPLLLVVMAVEETAQLEGVPSAQIWIGVAKLETRLRSNRGRIWR